MKINKALVFGAGYVGTSLAVLLSQEIKVLVIDNDEEMMQDEILKIAQSDAGARNPWVGEEKPKKDIPKVQKGLSWMD